jgi:hypothetical protein
MRKRLYQGLLSLSLLSVASLGSLGLYGYRQLTAAPDNIMAIAAYQNTYQRHQSLHQAALSTVKKIYANPRRPDGSVIAQINTQDLNAMFALTLALRVEEKRPYHILKGTHVEQVGQKLKTTALFDLSQISYPDLQGGNRLSLLRRFLKTPGLRDRAIAMSVEGTPTLRDNSIALQDPVIGIGNLKLTPAQARQWLGTSDLFLQEILDQEFNNLPIVLERVQWVTPTPQQEPLIQLEGQLTAW